MRRGPHTPIFDPKPRRGTINPGVQISGETGACSPAFVLQSNQMRDAYIIDTRWCVYGNGYFYIQFGTALTIVDVAVPEVVGFVVIPEMNFSSADYGQILSPSGNYLYLCSPNYATPLGGVWTIDVSDPTSPTLVHSLFDPIVLPNAAVGGVRDGNYLYVTWITAASPFPHLAIIDVSVESTPALAYSELHADNQSSVLLVQDGLMFTRPDEFSSGDPHAIYDVSSPLAPVLLGTYTAITPEFAEQAVLVGDRLWFVGNGVGGVGVIDVSDPTDPFQVGAGYLTPLINLQTFDGDGNLAVGAYTTSISVMDLSDAPRRPRAVGTLLDTTNFATGITNMRVEGSWAYVITSTRVTTVNLSTPSAPTIGTTVTANMAGGGNNFDFCKAGNFLYVPSVTNDRLNIYDVTSPAAMTQVASLADSTNLDEPRATAVIGNYCFVGTAAPGGRFTVVDVSNPAAPFVAASVTGADYGITLTAAAVGDCIYLGLQDQITVVDVSNPLVPSVAYVFTDPSYDTYSNRLEKNGDGSLLFVTMYNEQGGLILNVSNPAAPSLLSTIDLGSNGNGVYFVGDFAYVGVDFPLEPAVRALDVSNPAVPLWIGSPSPYPINWANNIVVGETPTVLYVASEANDFFLWKLDISDPDYPVTVDWVPEGAAVQGQTSTAFDNGEVINMSDMGVTVSDTSLNVLRRFNSASTYGIGGWLLDGDRLYISGETNEVIVSIWDVSNPAIPALLGYLSIPGTGVPGNADTIRSLSGDLAYQNGTLAVFSDTGPGMVYLLDVTGSTPTVLGTFNFDVLPGFISHNEGRFIIDGDYLYVKPTDYFYVFDISDPANPTIVGSIDDSLDLGYTNMPNQMWKRGDYIFFAAEDSFSFIGRLNVIDVSDPANPFLVGALTNDSAFNQDWSVGVLDNNILYIASHQRLTAVNINNPLAPTIVGTLTSSLLANPDSMVKGGNHLYITNGSVIRRVNVTNPTSMSINLSYTASLPSSNPAQGYGEHIMYVNGYVYVGDTYIDNDFLPYSQRGSVWIWKEDCI